MATLSSLINKINSFYKLAESFVNINKIAAPPKEYIPTKGPTKTYEGYDPYAEEEDYKDDETDQPVEQGDTALYTKVLNKIEDLNEESDKYEDVTNEVAMIAELFKTSVTINGGFTELNKAIAIAIANIDSMIDDSDGVIDENVKDTLGDLLTEMSNEATTLSRTSISQQMDEPAALKALRDAKQNFIGSEGRGEMASQKSVYDTTFKPGGQSSSFTAVKGPPETPEKYTREIKRLTDSLQHQTDPSMAAYTKSLVQTLTMLVSQMSYVTTLKDDLKVTPDDPAKQKELSDAVAALDRLRIQQRDLKSKLNKILLNLEKSDLQSKLTSTRNPQEKKWYEEQIKLLDVRMSTDTKKRDEIKARKNFIKALGVVDSHGDFQPLTISPTELMAFERTIALGKDTRVSRTAYDRSRTEQRAKEEGREDVAKRSGKGGWASGTKALVPNPESLPQLLRRLREGINTALSGVTYYIWRKETGVKEGYPELKPYVDAVAKAIQKKDQATKFAAINSLRDKVREYIANRKRFNKPDPVGSYEIAIRLRPFCEKIEERFKQIASWQQDGQWNLTEEQKTFCRDTTEYIAKFIKVYNKEYEGKRSNFSSYVENVLPDAMKFVENYVLGETYNPDKQIRIAPQEDKPILVAYVKPNGDYVADQITVEQLNKWKQNRQVEQTTSNGQQIQIIHVLDGDLEEASEPSEEKKKMRLQSILERKEMLKYIKGIANV